MNEELDELNSEAANFCAVCRGRMLLEVTGRRSLEDYADRRAGLWKRQADSAWCPPVQTAASVLERNVDDVT